MENKEEEKEMEKWKEDNRLGTREGYYMEREVA